MNPNLGKTKLNKSIHPKFPMTDFWVKYNKVTTGNKARMVTLINWLVVEPPLWKILASWYGKYQMIQPPTSYPLVNIQKTIGNGHRNSWFTHQQWWCSIVFFVNVSQRVNHQIIPLNHHEYPIESIGCSNINHPNENTSEVTIFTSVPMTCVDFLRIIAHHL